MSRADFRLSLVVPVYNEEESIDAFISAIDTELAPLKDQLEIVFVNDGSRDRTREVVEQAIARDPRVTLVNLARNFGKEAAMTAGLHQAKGDAIVPMDVDLQDPPLSFWSSSSCGRPATMTPSTASGWIAAPIPR
jgi:glycosyltransferase involved in cell wall biosynthesis